MPETFVSWEELPDVFRLGAAHLVELMVESAQLAAALRKMQADAQREGIVLPDLQVPYLGDLQDAAHPACRLAKAAIGAGVFDGDEPCLVPTCV